ncbi:type I methionyl aminopeptidase [Alpinimonas psychrophila]|nr:type I methionyl aminopeptidase [Alpinimonas psychrophila]
MAFRSSIYKNPAQLLLMVKPGLMTAASLAAARRVAVAGATTTEVDAAAEAAIIALGGKPNFKLVPGYHHTVCTSINDEVVHGIPGERILQPGDILSVDSGAIFDGWNGDSAITLVVPDPSRPDVVAEREQLSRVTEAALWTGIARLARAKYLNEVGEAIEGFVEDEGERLGHTYGILTDYIGHGIGRDMHEDPPVFNYRVRQKGPEVKPGLVVAIEPMVVMGSPETKILADGWTVSTVDGGSASQWEHTVAIHRDGIWVLTAEDGGAAKLAAHGITPTPFA